MRKLFKTLVMPNYFRNLMYLENKKAARGVYPWTAWRCALPLEAVQKSFRNVAPYPLPIAKVRKIFEKY